MRHLQTLWTDEAGFILSAELVVISTVVVLGLITGLKCVQTALVGEMKDVAGAFDSLNQSYYFTGMHGCWSCDCGYRSFTRGSCFFDQQDSETALPCDIGFAPCRTDLPFSSPAVCPPAIIEGETIIDGCTTPPCDPIVTPDGCTECETPGCTSGCEEQVPILDAAPKNQDGEPPLPADDSSATSA